MNWFSPQFVFLVKPKLQHNPLTMWYCLEKSVFSGNNGKIFIDNGINNSTSGITLENPLCWGFFFVGAAVNGSDHYPLTPGFLLWCFGQWSIVVPVLLPMNDAISLLRRNLRCVRSSALRASLLLGRDLAARAFPRVTRLCISSLSLGNIHSAVLSWRCTSSRSGREVL